MQSQPPFRSIGPMRERLRRRSEELRELIRKELLQADKEQYGELAGRVHDLADESVADLLADVNLAVIDHHVNEVRSVESALLRIATGSYGECADCGEAIDTARLEAYPTAKRCHACQSLRERTYAQPGHPTL